MDEEITPEVRAELASLQREALAEVGRHVIARLYFREAVMLHGKPAMLFDLKIEIEGGRVIQEHRGMVIEVGGTLSITGMEYEGGASRHGRRAPQHK
jgi:hypothetical protein